MTDRERAVMFLECAKRTVATLREKAKTEELNEYEFDCLCEAETEVREIESCLMLEEEGILL